MADFIKTLWSDKIIQALYEDQNLNMMFDRSLESYVRSQGGKSVVLPILGANGSIQRTDNKSIGDGLPLDINDVSKDGKQLDIYEYTYGPINMRKIDDVQSNMSLMTKHVTEIKQAFVEDIFTSALTHIINNVDSTHKLDWTAGTSGDSFSFDDLRKMRKAFNDAKISLDGRYCSLGTDAEDDLAADDYLKNWFAVNQQAVQNGRLPNLSGFGFTPSILVPLTKADGSIDADPANNIKKNVVAWRKNHMNLVIQTELEITGAEDAQYLGVVAAFTVRYGVLLERAKGAVISTQQG